MSSPVWIIGPVDGCMWDRATLREELERNDPDEQRGDELDELDDLPEWQEVLELTAGTVGTLTRGVLGGTWTGAYYRTDAGEWYVTDIEGAPVTSYGDELPHELTFWRCDE